MNQPLQYGIDEKGGLSNVIWIAGNEHLKESPA
jgi:hypothetical protein